ncbi:exosortase P [Umezawaea tangerina]|uniref:Exosortase/archaeosortase family protein n=1 Tax=Umezawaea tangerina TaxID=84725 RepID=A0A2T0SP95_9PSEU|nr:exosortase P [Umezawaea tangerina]PRY35227.1 exosortase/archaeosortase family protein [Umezawaea tangerina]
MALADSPAARRTDLPSRVVVVALLGVAAALVFANRAYRDAEISVSGLLLGAVDPDGVAVVAERQTVYFGLHSGTPLGLRMTPECTSAFLVLPLLVIGAVMVALRPRVARRVLLAVGVAAVAVVVVNQVRVLALAGLVEWLGTDTGYYWGHTLLGSMVSVLGGAAALVLFARLATRG